MRILYTHRTQGVGAEGAHILGMYEAFAELGHELRMDCLPGCNPAQQAASEHISEASGEKTSRPPTLKRILWFFADHFPETVFELFEIAYNLPLAVRFGLTCLRFRPNLVYERYALNTFAPTLICRLLRIPHILEVNDSVVIERSRPLAFKHLAAFSEGFCLAGADASITITEKFRALLAARFPGCGNRVMVLPNAVSGKRFAGNPDRRATRARLGLGERIVIGASGQFLPWHGLAELVAGLGDEAVRRNLFFLFIGDGPVREEILGKASRMGIADRLRFTGMVPIKEVPGFLGALDLAVIPSAAVHASPMKLLEYMGAGLPIVAPDLPSIRAALPDDDMAAIFPPGDMAAMRRAILAILDDRGAGERMGEKARAHVLDTLTWTRHAEKVLERLSLGGTPASPPESRRAATAGS